MNNYKALFLDIDGTLVPDGIMIPSPRVQTAVRSITDRIIVSIATGRPLLDVEALIDCLGLQHHCVLLNGVIVYDPVKQQTIKEYTLSTEVFAKIQRLVDSYTTNYKVYDGITEYAPDNIPVSSTMHSIFLPNESEAIIDALFYQLEQIPGIHAHKGLFKGNYNLHVTSSEASKLHGVVSVQDIYQLKKEECIAVGDGYNDFALLLSCGLKVAMGNAVPELKAEADFICPSIEHDGVAVIIEKLLL